jgi:hypothetical protein
MINISAFAHKVLLYFSKDLKINYRKEEGKPL